MPASTPPRQAAPDPFAAVLHRAFLPTIALAAVGVAVLWATMGPRPAWSALLAVLVTVVFFAMGLLVLLALRRSRSAAGFLGAALAVVGVQLGFLLAVIVVLGNAAWLDGPVFGFAALVVTVVWQALQLRALVRSRQLVYDESRPATGPEVSS